MEENWMLHRLRSAFLRANILLIVLRLLSGEELTEWEILSLLHSRYGVTASAKEFRRLYNLMVGGGYARVEYVGTTRKLHITESGADLLHRLEEEYRDIVSGFGVSSSVVLTR